MKIYHEIDLLFESWKRRKLSLFGKCTIINALALSKMTYVASILELPDPKYIKDINKLIFKFLWNKQDRIKRNTLIGDIKDGGIGIVDMESKLRALKATWIPRLVTSNHILKRYVGSFCKPLNIDIDYLIKTSETSIDDYGILKKFPVFYEQVFSCFNLCQDNSNQTLNSTEKFLSQPIWSNRIFLFQGKSICFDDWIKSGILYTKDIFNEDGLLKSGEQICDYLKKKTNWLCEYKIVRHIFKKFELRFDFSKIPYVLFKKIEKKIFLKQNTKNFYSTLIKHKFQKPSLTKLSREFQITDKKKWESIFLFKVKYINDKSLAEFNYKLIHNLLCNNLLISKWDKTITNKCKQCRDDIENAKHLIFDCSNVQHIWKIASMCIKFTISWKHVVIGFYLENNELSKMYNYFISFIAYRIYKCKMYCRVVQIIETNEFIIRSIKEYFREHCQVLKLLRRTKEQTLFHNFVNNL